MKMPDTIPTALLAPCGLDCMLCHHHCKSDAPCEGCREGRGKSKHCKECELRLCAESRGLQFCNECEDFPCAKLEDFNGYYIRRYGHEFLPNAVYMKENGQRALTEQLIRQWKCPQCGGVVCIHDNTCSECGWKLPE